MSKPISELSAKVTPTRSRLGEWIAIKRKDLGLNQRELARASGLCQAQISLIERGMHSPAIDTLESICSAMGEKLWRAVKAAEESQS